MCFMRSVIESGNSGMEIISKIKLPFYNQYEGRQKYKMVHGSILYDPFVICINLQCHVMIEGIT